MHSIIPGYNYDIFISYRQKDNKGDMWVSEFVEALKTELESTFKEEVSVYFDINPHDGLLETHDVGDSLKEKLRCLVFIPIFSRTYCDPKSFAWEHEFKAFVELASKDQFGLKVKLPNGNVANRVLPVRIHDLDEMDIKTAETVLGGVLRGVEFIYKELGVNRPLKPADVRSENQNNTDYRNQVNKVALTIKDILSGLGPHTSTQDQRLLGRHKRTMIFDNGEVKTGRPKTNRLKKIYLIPGILLLAVSVFLTYHLWPVKLPLIVIMDSPYKTRVYDTSVFNKGLTNADVISDILLDLPVKRQLERISPEWHRDEEILNFDPDLIIIHYSGFIQGDNGQPRIRLRSFINFFKNSDTEFLIYSRLSENNLRQYIDTLLLEDFAEFPDLKSRIHVFGLLEYNSRSWLDPVTANALKLKVKDILNVD